MSIVPKKNRDDLYRFLFTEGVLCCHKNRLGTWSGELGGKKFSMPCHQIMLLMRSLNSKKLIKEQFAWRHFYWFLNDAGVAYLRNYLHLAESVVPNSQKATKGGEREYERAPRREGGDGPRGGRGAGRGAGRGRGFGRGRGGDGEGAAPFRGRGRGFGGRGARGGFGAERADYASGEGSAPAAPAVESPTRGGGFGFGRGRGRGAAAPASE